MRRTRLPSRFGSRHIPFRRRGITTLEYVLVGSVITIISIVAISFLNDSADNMQNVAGQIAHLSKESGANHHADQAQQMLLSQTHPADVYSWLILLIGPIALLWITLRVAWDSQKNSPI